MWLVDKSKILKNKYRLTFKDVAAEWLEIKKKEIKKSTYANYAYAIEKYLLPEFKKCSLKCQGGSSSKPFTKIRT